MDRLNANPVEKVPDSPRSLAGVIRHLIGVRRKFGTRAVVQWLIDRTMRRFMQFQVENLVCFDVDRLPELPAVDANINFRFLTADEIRAFAADPANQLDHSMAERAASRQSVCLAVFVDDRLAGYGWCAFGCIDPQDCGGLSMRCPHQVGYMYKGFTHSEFRGMRLNGLRVLVAAKYLAARGVRQLVALIDWTNWSSMHSSVDAGCTVLGRLVTIGVGRHRWSFYPKAARQVGIEFGPRDWQKSRREIVESRPRAAISDYTCA